MMIMILIMICMMNWNDDDELVPSILLNFFE